MANHLKREKQEAAIRCLLDGNSIRGTERIVGAHRDTIMRLMVRVGQECAAMSDDVLRNLNCRLVQCDEIWCYVGAKQKALRPEHPSEYGDAWTWVALDAETKLVPCYRVGKRERVDANAFLADLASRVMGRIQLSTDGLGIYVDAAERAFGGEVDYAQIVKRFASDQSEERRYSPAKVWSVDRYAISGNPDRDHVCTSYVERQNLTMRMCMRRFTRLTNAFSKKLENLQAAVALHFAYYNFVRMHSTLNATPAMAAGVTSSSWEVGQLIP